MLCIVDAAEDQVSTEAQSCRIPLLTNHTQGQPGWHCPFS